MTFLEGFFSCRAYRLKRLLLAIMIISLASNTLATQESQSLSCPSAGELRPEMAARLEKLGTLKWGLERFTAGKSTGEIPVTALFMIDLADPDAVTQRVVELQQEASSEKAGAKPQDPFIGCALSSAELRALADEVLSLQSDVSRLRLQFLTLPPEKRAAILHPQIEATAQADTVKQLQEERSSAMEEQKQAAKSLVRAEQQALATEVGVSGSLAVEKAALEKSKSELATVQVKWIADLENQAAYYQDTTNQLAEVGRHLLIRQGDEEAKTYYEKTVSIWRSLVDNTHQVVSSRFAVSLPPLPEYPEKLLAKAGDTPEARQYATAYADAKAFRDSLQEKIRARLQDSVDLHYRVLLQSGEIRSQLLNELLDLGDHSPLALSMYLFQDVRREFTIVPYRWAATFYLRSLDIHTNLSKGWEGWMEAAGNLAVLLALLMVPFALWKGSKRLIHSLNRLRVHLVRHSQAHPKAGQLALAIQNILPYTFWLAMLLAVFVSQRLVAGTVFRELALLLPYVSYYIYYRLFRQFMRCDYIWVNQLLRAEQILDLRRQVDIAVRSLGLSALIIFSFLNAIESLIRRGLIYHLATAAMAYLGVLIALGFSYQWREIIAAGLAKLIPSRLGLRLGKLCNSRYGLILCLPIAILIVLLLVMREIREWSNRFEFAKRIAAEIFRYQLGSAVEKGIAAKSLQVPGDYRQWFITAGIADPASLHEPKTEGFSIVCDAIEAWRNDSAVNHTLAIVGNQGTGKTCMLSLIEQHFPACRILKTSVPAKLAGRQQTIDFLGKILEGESRETPLDKPGEESPKTLVLIDDAHNFFLAAPGGFEGFKAVLERINQPSENIFWCLVFNIHAWIYLNSVTACGEFFGAVVKLMGWPESDIQALILSLHDKSGFRLSYDDIIQAVGIQVETEDISYIENRFFRMLCQQSRGNPRLAILLWLSAVRRVGEKALRVGLPEQVETAFFSAIQENALFVHAGIARHGNLSLREAATITQLPEEMISQALASGVRMKLLEPMGNTRFRLAPLYQYPLINYLLAKHFLYE